MNEIALGRTHLGKEKFEDAAKLVIGPGKASSHLLAAAEGWEISILSAGTLQKLTEVWALYPGIFSLDELQPYFKTGIIDEQIEQFINENILNKLDVHVAVMALVQQVLPEAPKSATADRLLGLFRNDHPALSHLGDNDFHDILIELASPLTGYLKREKAPQKWADRFYFLREL
jgi:hypothetical protein